MNMAYFLHMTVGVLSVLIDGYSLKLHYTVASKSWKRSRTIAKFYTTPETSRDLRNVTTQLIATRTRRQLSACMIVVTQLSQGPLAIDKGIRSVSRSCSIVMVDDSV